MVAAVDGGPPMSAADVLRLKLSKFLRYKTDQPVDAGPNDKTTPGTSALALRGTPEFGKDVADIVAILLEQAIKHAEYREQQPAALDTTGPIDAEGARAIRVLQSRFDTWKGEVRGWVTNQRSELGRLAEHVIRLQTRTDCPTDGPVEPLQTQPLPTWERVGLWVAAGLGCSCSMGAFVLAFAAWVGGA